MQDLRSARQAQGGDPHLPRPQPPRLFRDGGIALITAAERERERERGIGTLKASEWVMWSQAVRSVLQLSLSTSCSSHQNVLHSRMAISSY